MTKSAKEGDSATTAGCTGAYSPYPSYSYTPTPSCPSGQLWDSVTNSCRTNTTSCAPGYYLANPNDTSCTPISSTSPTSCPSGQWWDTATSSCKSSTTTGYCGDHVCGSGETSTSCYSDCGGGTSYTPYPTTSYTPYPSCPSGQWWDSATSSCKSTTSTYTYTPAPSCPASQYWNGTSCIDNVTTTYTPYPTTDPSASCTSSGGTWNGSSCVYPTPVPTTVYTPYPTTTYSPPPTSSLYPQYMVAHCQQLGRTWNGEICRANGLFARIYESYTNDFATILKAFGF